MKAIKILTHPYTVIIGFFMIMISGQHWGGFYLLYLLIALPHAGIHAILAFIGVLLLLICYNKYKGKKAYRIESIVNVISVFLLVLSLYLFFYNDKEKYNFGTFTQLVPQISLALFSIIALFFMYDNIAAIFKSRTGNKTNDRIVNC